MPTFDIASHHLTLHRFPVLTRETLQAWDAADEYLLDTLLADLSRYTRILILNDGFGALTCTLAVAASGNTQLFHMTDSYIAQQGCIANITQNHIDADITFLTSLDDMPANIDCVIMKVPRSLAFLSHQLSQLQPVMTESTTLIAGAKVKDIHTSTLTLFEQYIGHTRTSLAKKKARLIHVQPTQHKIIDTPPPIIWALEGSAYHITNLANVFSRAHLDIGGRFLIENLPTDQSYSHIIDLGCGNGVVGLMAGTLHTNARITCVDESFMAVASAQQNLSPLDNTVHCVADDCLSQLKDNCADLVLCNPPFHQQNTISDHIAWQMFNDAKRVLKTEGTFVIVGNRHLQYHLKLKKIFGNLTQVNANKKFVVLRSVKQ